MAIRVSHLADALIEDGFDVSVLSTSQEGKSDRYSVNYFAAPTPTNKDNVYVRLIKELLISTEAFVRVLCGPRQTYLISSPPFTLASAAAWACRIRSLPHIFDVRDEYPDVYFSEGLVKEYGWLGRTLRRIERKNYHGASLVTTVTEKIKSKLVERAEGKTEVYLLRNGYAGGIDWIQDHWTDPFIAIFHGNMGKFQSPETIVTLAERCNQEGIPVLFHIYGWGARIDVIKEASDRLSNLHLFDEISHEEIPTVLKKASVGISFQGNSEISKNSFPSKVMEFIGSGIPMMISPISEAGQFVEKEGIGLQFDPQDSQGIFDAVVSLISEPEKLVRMREKMLPLKEELSRKRISQDFSSFLKTMNWNK